MGRAFVLFEISAFMLFFEKSRVLSLGGTWVPSLTYSSEFMVAVYPQTTATRSMAQLLGFWKRLKMVGYIS